MKKLSKGCFLTDIHFGKKSNSSEHNQDCLDYVDWFCDQVRSDSTIDYVGFLGDWNENRSAINLETLMYSYRGGKKLNDLGLPVLFVVGNHDLYRRNTRDIYSVLPFAEFSNFQIIDQPTVITTIGNGVLFSPYLFHDEYDDLKKYLDLQMWAGHFEFKGFRITGYNMLMPTGPDPLGFAGPKHILSGHFHQRQSAHNIHYIGNTFPMDFGDANDFKRGLAVYDHTTEKLTFKNWANCPKYIKMKLSTLLDDDVVLPTKARVTVKVDESLELEETTAIRDMFMKKFSLREFTMEESSIEELENALTETEGLAEEGEKPGIELQTVDQMVVKMLGNISTDKIDNNLLIAEYNTLIND